MKNKIIIFLASVMLPLMTAITFTSCEDEDAITYSGKIENNRISALSSVTPGQGAQLTISGSNMNNVVRVFVGNVQVTKQNFISQDDSQIVITVPTASGLGENDLVVVWPGSVTATTKVNVVKLQSVSSIGPRIAAAGQTVTLFGSNLDIVNEVTINNVSAQIVSKSLNSLKFTMPSGAATGKVVLKSNAGTYQTETNLIACESEPGNINCIAPINLNGNFEEGTASAFTYWNVFNSGNPAGSATITVGSGSDQVFEGDRSMKVVNPTAYPGSQWRVQVASDLFPTEPGKTYRVSYWVKAASNGGSIRLSTQPNASYQGDQTIGSNWQEITWTFTVTNSSQTATRIVFDMGQAANTYYIDYVRVIAQP